MKRNILVRQHDSNDCAPACLAMVSTYYGKKMELYKFRNKMQTQRKGTILSDLVKTANDIGFISKPIRVDKDGFQTEFTLPSIAQVLLENGQSHFVVIREIYKNKVVILDPSKGKRVESIDSFFKYFTGLMVLLTPNNNIFIKKNEEIANKKVFRRFLTLLTPHKWMLTMIILASITLTVTGVVGSFFNQIIFDQVIPNNLDTQLLVFTLLFLGVSLAQVVIGFIRAQLAIHVSQKMDISLVLNYFKHIFNLPLSFFSTKKTGDILTRFGDSFVIKNVLTNLVLTVFLDLILALGTGIILYNISKELFMIIAVMTVIHIIIVYLFKEPFKKYNLKKMEQDSRLNSTIVESLNAINYVKSSNHEKSIMERVEKHFIKALKIDFRMQHLANLHDSLSSTLMTFGSLSLISYGAFMVMNETMSIGVLLTFTVLSSFFMDPINRLVNMQLEIQEADISMKRLSEILDSKEEPLEDDKKIEFEGIQESIKFNDLSFGYRSGKETLKDINISLKEGERTAIVGTSGSGKSTLAKLLVGLHRTYEGSITIDELNIHDYSLSSLRKRIGYCQQDVQLLPGTVFENLTLGQEHHEVKDTHEILHKIGCSDFIHALDDGYETQIEESGVGLSGGEKQMINLARCLLKKPELIVLDEATSNMDSMREKQVFEHLYTNFPNETMVIIAHKLSLIKNCDKIIVFKGGKIAEIGSHSTLMENEGEYYRLWNAQHSEIQPGGLKGTNSDRKKEPPYPADDDVFQY
ncbi:peptidase domain-containing ABC transporter [Rossellomorea marisflavi]|uniref:peptidase domain-containing ABC transporter n=1 Tax=Rossellomorea marisflavi TaxID=189381 RepID=UPI002797D679|nr:peptidase domain-containing ABC transporter [Rossellomorea marisflavi]UTE73452.1 peptidase domain-containing ABC transporter [Rossellomorea marisflavi]